MHIHSNNRGRAEYQGSAGKALLNQVDLFHNGSVVLMLVTISSLATTSKFQENICFKMRVVSLININTKECKGGRYSCMKVVYVVTAQGKVTFIQTLAV